MMLAALLALGCDLGGDSSAKRDAGRDGPLDGQASVGFPEVPAGCPPAAGNESGVGAPCTRTGNECPGSLQCSCRDWFGYAMPAEMPCFCTSVSFGPSCTSACGSQASCCGYDVPLAPTSTVTVSACFPAVCLIDGQCPVIDL